MGFSQLLLAPSGEYMYMAIEPKQDLKYLFKIFDRT